MPLRALKQADTDDVLQSLIRNGYLKKDVDVDEYIEFAMSKNFMDPRYKGEFQYFNRFVMNPKMLDVYLSNESSNLGEKVEVFWRDGFLINEVIKKWRKYKQVYKIDKEFFFELVQTEGIVIPENFAQYIPLPDMYIDLSEIEEIKPIEGAFVHAVNTDHGWQLIVYMIIDSLTIFSFYSDFTYENGVFEMPDLLIPSSKFCALDLTHDTEKAGYHKYDNDCRAITCKAIIQIMMYLSSKEPDITENALTKRTYKPTSTPKDKFSEVRIWDVGIRYGNAIRIAKKEAEECEKEAKKTEANEEKGSRKQPRAHVRKAHWHRYRVGKGKKEIRINWIAPVIVCGDKKVPVTIQKITA